MIAHLVAIAVLTITGPFGTTHDFELWDRLIFWSVLIIVVGFVISEILNIIINSPYLAKLHISVRLLIGCLVGAVPGSSFVVFINQIMRPHHLEGTTFFGQWAQVALLAFLIGGAIVTAHEIMEIQRKLKLANSDDPEDSPDNAPAALPPTLETQLAERLMPRSPLHAKLPDEAQHADIISLSMQDHYVVVNTTQGSHMILMRLSDALTMLDGLPGAQAHRSHWIAAAHLVSCEKDGRRFEAKLSDGSTLPVSKQHAPQVFAILNAKGDPQAAF